jgi:hypothetical protein
MLRQFTAAALALLAAAPQDAGSKPAPSPELAQLVKTFEERGVHLDPARKLCSIPVDVEIRDDLLEYLLVGPGGAVHETAFRTPVQPSVLNAALLALGLEAGTNAVWKPKEPQPTEEELRAGAMPYDIDVPHGDALYLYVGWRKGTERYFFRVEDLIRNLGTGQSMTRHQWVFLGSRMVTPAKKGAEAVFAADVYHNLINISFFPEGYTLLTGGLPECISQNIWMVNAWLVPERGTRVTMIFSRERIESMASDVDALLPEVVSQPEDPKDR